MLGCQARRVEREGEAASMRANGEGEALQGKARGGGAPGMRRHGRRVAATMGQGGGAKQLVGHRRPPGQWPLPGAEQGRREGEREEKVKQRLTDIFSNFSTKVQKSLNSKRIEYFQMHSSFKIYLSN